MAKFKEGDKVAYAGNWTKVVASGEHGTVIDEVFPGLYRVKWASGHRIAHSKETLTLRPPTIHDQARELFEMAMIYAEDGAFYTAADRIRQIADLYKNRADIMPALVTEHPSVLKSPKVED